MTPDLKGVRYVNSSNQPILNGTFNHHYRNDMSRTRKNKLDAVPFVVYTPWGHRCCQHNSAMGWPYFAENLFHKAADGGIAAWLYSSAVIRAEIYGKKITITEETSYPFVGEVTFVVDCEHAVEFPFYIRIPGWCRDFSLQVNDEPLLANDTGDDRGDDSAIAGATVAGSAAYVKCQRSWRRGDCITFNMEMPCRVKRWPLNGSATILREPLAFSVKIERWVSDLTPSWPSQTIPPRGAFCPRLQHQKDTAPHRLRTRCTRML